MQANYSYLSRQPKPSHCTELEKSLWLVLVTGINFIFFLYIICMYHKKKKLYESRIHELEAERDGRVPLL